MTKKPRTEKGFVVSATRTDGLHAVFEDDGDTGYLYLYDDKKGILDHLHIYTRNPKLTVVEDDVFACWTTNEDKCGVVIRQEMRGIMDVARDRQGRVFMETDDTPGIDDAAWLEGFERE